MIVCFCLLSVNHLWTSIMQIKSHCISASLHSSRANIKQKRAAREKGGQRWNSSTLKHWLFHFVIFECLNTFFFILKGFYIIVTLERFLYENFKSHYRDRSTTDPLRKCVTGLQGTACLSHMEGLLQPLIMVTISRGSCLCHYRTNVKSFYPLCLV